MWCGQNFSLQITHSGCSMENILEGTEWTWTVRRLLQASIWENGSLEQGGIRRNGKKWTHSKYYLETELTGLEDEKSSIKDSQVLAWAVSRWCCPPVGQVTMKGSQFWGEDWKSSWVWDVWKTFKWKCEVDSRLDRSRAQWKGLDWILGSSVCEDNRSQGESEIT